MICGVLRAETLVAVKVFTPSSCDESCIAKISTEAALCGALQHPNIVKFYGICVSPPMIGLVHELCEASLEDVGSSITRRTQHPDRQALLINVAYMLDAARAVAYLHSFSPPFLHRKIKPSSFMVDAEHSVKLTEFGDTCWSPDSATLEVSINDTIEYVAPEMLIGYENSALYGEAADVYALGMTMWDIVNCGWEKYPAAHGNRTEICEIVKQGQRPEINKSMSPSLREVIESAWHADPHQRLSANQLVNMLVSIQEQLAAEFAVRLREELDEVQVIEETHEEAVIDILMFTGANAIACMEEHNYVASRAEGMRLGNALLDTCVVQPRQGRWRFEDNTRVYFFDEDNISLCEPFAGFQLRALPWFDRESGESSHGHRTTTTSSMNS